MNIANDWVEYQGGKSWIFDCSDCFDCQLIAIDCHWLPLIAIDCLWLPLIAFDCNDCQWSAIKGKKTIQTFPDILGHFQAFAAIRNHWEPFRAIRKDPHSSPIIRNYLEWYCQYSQSEFTFAIRIFQWDLII